LPQFLINADRSASHALIVEFAVHLLIGGHEIALEYFNELDRDDQTDGDEGAEEDEIGTEGYPCLSETVDVVACYEVYELMVGLATEVPV